MTGIFILDKPEGFTSFDAVAVARRLFGQKKIGHTGTLDPMATGVLPLLLGRATRAESLLPDTEKEYRASFALGTRTDTGDITGETIDHTDARVSREQLFAVLPRFRGEILQVPPMYSAIKKDGKRLYELARKGIEVEREARPVTIERLELLRFDEEQQAGELLVSCSKGTYIRALIEDLAAAAGTLGTMTALRRTRACGFSLADAVPLDEARRLAETEDLSALVRPVEGLFAVYPAVTVSTAQAARFANGGALEKARTSLRGNPLADGERLRVLGPDGQFLGLAETAEGELRVLRLFCEPSPGRKETQA